MMFEKVYMKKAASVFTVLVCAIALCSLLVGCGGAASSQDAEKYIGVWDLSSIEVSSNSETASVTESDIELMQSLGMTITLTLDADNKATLNRFGELIEGEWTCKSSGEAGMTLEGQKITLSITDDGRLKMSQAGDSIFFKRADAASGDTGEGGSATGAQDGSDPSTGTQDGNDVTTNTQGGNDATTGNQGENGAATDNQGESTTTQG